MPATVRFLKRIGVALAGSALIVAGIAMLFLPGPGIVTIIAGLAVLGTEFETPRRWVAALRKRFNLRRSSAEDPPEPNPPLGTPSVE